MVSSESLHGLVWLRVRRVPYPDFPFYFYLYLRGLTITQTTYGLLGTQGREGISSTFAKTNRSNCVYQHDYTVKWADVLAIYCHVGQSHND